MCFYTACLPDAEKPSPPRTVMLKLHYISTGKQCKQTNYTPEPLKNDSLKTTFLLGRSLFRRYVKLPAGIYI